MRDYVKEYNVNKAVSKRLMKMGAGENVIKSDRELRILKTTGVDVVYEVKNEQGQFEKRRLYLYRKNKKDYLNDMSDIVAELDIERRFTLLPRRGLQMAERGTLKRAKMEHIDYTKMHPDIAQLQYNASRKAFKKWKENAEFALGEGLTIDRLEGMSEALDELTDTIWSTGDSETLNEYYHVFGATDTSETSIAAYKLWKERS